ncbi:MAG TPA: GGDEF domain-containing protein [Xanthobacteraceae bacterium]|nr:GGDEF domain-containing protein [Xanthobacteraceae bacterium]
MASAATWEPSFLSNLPAGPAERRLAFAAILVSTAVFLLLAPFARRQLPPLPAFIPIYQSALVINDLITVVFLFGQRQISQGHGLSVLAGGYLFTALMCIAHALTFPGLFASAGLLGAGPQTTAWLYMFWHGGFPLFVIGYVARQSSGRPWQARRTAVPAVLALVIGAAFGCVMLATRLQEVLPPIMQGNRHTPAMDIVVWSVWLLSLLALLALTRRQPFSVLDLWLAVTMCAWLFDIALSAGLDAGRYDLGFYAGRIYGLLAAFFIHIVWLTKNGRLYVALVRLRASDQAKAEELRRLTALDALTGIANRRAFEEALDQEWRRMMRHRTALSLLMIDVDFFKRFNDGYGHVAGDQCLRAVARVLAKRARRAGEIAARYGGEEFAVLLPHTDIAAARQLGELMCRAVRDEAIPHQGSGVAPFVTISIGVACIADVPASAGAQARDAPSHETAAVSSAVLLVETADRALYEAKLAGRNRVIAACQDDVLAASALPAADMRLPSAA